MLNFCFPQALQILHSGDIKESVITKNSFRQSNHRCIAVEGTSNITISGNTGYKTFGHCIYMGFESHSNQVIRNLVSDTRKISGDQVIPNEKDGSAAGFWNYYGPNDLIQNVAVGGER